MVFLMERLSVCCWAFDLDQLMVSILVLIQVLYLTNHLLLLTDSYLLNMMEYILSHQDATLVEIHMAKIRVCC